MDTTHDDTKPLTTRLLASKRLLIVVMCLSLALSSIGVGLAQQDFDLNEGFEDGDTYIDESGWEGWTETGAVDFEVISTDSIAGTYSGTVTAPSSIAFDEIVGIEARRDTNTTAIQEFLITVEMTQPFDSATAGMPFNIILRDSDGTATAHLQFGMGDTSDGVFAGDGTELLDSWNADTEYDIRMYDFDSTANTVNISIEGGGQSADEEVSMAGGEHFQEIDLQWYGNDLGYDVTALVDDITVATADRYRITGRVTDQDGNPIRDGTIEADDGSGTVVTDDLNETGHYQITQLGNGTYTVTTSVPGHTNKSESVTIAGSSETQDFQLLNVDQSLEIDTRLFVEHGEEVPYTVSGTYIDNGSRVRDDVTEAAIVTSGNTSVITVDQVNTEIVGTSDTSVNYRTYIQAEWDAPDGNTYTDRMNVTVANETVENLDILPPVTRFGASIGDKTLQTILIATGVGAAAALITSAFGGIAALTLIMIMGWVIGVVGDGMIIVTLVTSMFIGLNVAGNVDYTVRR